MEDDRVALIDLDGTCVDYDLELRRQLETLRSPGEPEIDVLSYDDMPPWLSARIDLIKRQSGFWAELPRIEQGLDVCKFLEDSGFRLMVLTKGPRRTLSAWSEKAQWAAEHLPTADVTVTHDKGLVYGKVLFDDYPPYVLRWLEHRPRGKVLMLESPYNKEFEHPQVLRIPRQNRLDYEQGKMIEKFLAPIL